MHPTLGDLITELVHNSIEAGAERTEVGWRERGGRIEICVSDNGPGMEAATRRSAMDPFYTEPGKHRSRRVGLGLPFLAHAVEQTGGEWKLESSPGAGTRVWCSMDATHLDTPPAGDVAGAALAWFAFAASAPPPAREMVVRRECGGKGWSVSLSELAAAAGPLETAGALGLAKRWLESQESDVTVE